MIDPALLRSQTMYKIGLPFFGPEVMLDHVFPFLGKIYRESNGDLVPKPKNNVWTPKWPIKAY